MQGASLIEILLVFVIVMSLVILGLRQYQIFKTDQDLLQLQANVDALFEASSNFYHMLCYGTTDPSTFQLTPGILHPTANPPSMVSIDINNNLSKNGLLAITLPFNPLVDSNGPANGYVVQFNQAPAQARMQCTTGTSASGCSTPPSQIGVISTWRIQVAVLLKHPELGAQYQQMMGAQCLSSLIPGQVPFVSTCQAQKPGSYLVWERMPAERSFEQRSGLWSFMPVVSLFTQQYNTYPINYLLNTAGSIQASTPAQTQYFLCGS